MEFQHGQLCLIVLFIWLQLDFHSSIKIEITPSKLKANKDPLAKVKCTLDATETGVSEITWMKISRKGGRVMVVLNPDNKITFVEAVEDEVTPKGKIEKGGDVSKSSLEMDVLKPDKEDSGMYICSVSYNQTSGESKINKAHSMLNVISEDVNKMKGQVDDLLKQVDKEGSAIKDMEAKGKQVEKLVPDLEKKNKDTEKKLTDLVKKEEEFESKVNAMEDQATKQLNKFKELSQKEETEVKNIKSSVETLLKKRQKDKEELKNLSGKEGDSKGKVEALEKEAEKKTKDMEDLEEKEKKVEKKVNDLEVNTKSTLNKVKEFFDNKLAQEKKVQQVEDTINEKKTKLKELQEQEEGVETKLGGLEGKVEEAIRDLENLKTGPGSGYDTGNSGIDDDFGTDPYNNNNNNNNNDNNPKNNIMSAFAATIQQKYISPKSGANLVMPDVVMQAGLEGYNRNRGVYTAPTDGLYHFSLTLKVNCVSCYTQIAMRAYSNVIARLVTGTYYDENQNSVSAVVQLNKGTEVALHVEKAKPANLRLTTERLCSFSGYLIAPVI